MRRYLLTGLVLLAACAPPAPKPAPIAQQENPMTDRLAKYTTVRLTADLSRLTERERAMIPLLIDACREMDEIFWLEAWGDKAALLAGISDSATRRFAEINYGPWDRLADNEPFIAQHGPKPNGAGFYPPDMTRNEFDAAVALSAARAAELKNQYTLIRRAADGSLTSVPYHEAFAERIGRAAGKLREAASLADDAGLRRYLELRATALTNDNYRPSDLAWLDAKDNTVDVVIGPIETYEDALYGYKAAHEGYVLVKDRDWSARLSRYAALLPGLQRALPVPDEYKRETPGSDSDLNAYDVVYYAGDCNAGSKTIAINLPNDEEVQLAKGTRRLQLKNAMRAKFDRILAPIAERLISPTQLARVRFEAFFANTMFHEVAHGLGIKNTINGRGTVREALRDHAGSVEEGKADILGLWMITRLIDSGELTETSLEDHYVTFLAGIFRSIRFGAASAHGRSNLVQFNVFREAQAFQVDATTGTYSVDMIRMRAAVEALSEKLLRLQGDGDYSGVGEFQEALGRTDAGLTQSLASLEQLRIPVDVVFEQGPEVLGLR